MSGIDWAGGSESAFRPPYREIWAVDFEFVANDGDRPDPVCMVAKELRTSRVIRLWRNDLRKLDRAPFTSQAVACRGRERDLFLVMGHVSGF